MQKKLVLFLGMFAALATFSTAQSKPSQDSPGPNTAIQFSQLETGLARYLESGDDIKSETITRPRIVTIKASAVKSSISANTSSAAKNAFSLINEKRIENGLTALAWSDEIAAIARLHSQNMAEFKFFGHRGLDNKMVSDRADDAGLGRWRSIGENIAFNRGYQDPAARAVELWLSSPSHRTNLLNSNWRESAIGVAVAPDGSYYFTQVFLQKK